MRLLPVILFLAISGQSAFAGSPEDAFLEKAAASSEGMRSFETEFRQEKTIPFLSSPLVSEGKLCFERVRKSPAEDAVFLFWEYREPDTAGMLFSDGVFKLWSGNDAPREAGEGEKAALAAFGKEIAYWLSITPEKIQKDYSAGLSQEKRNTVILTPSRIL